MIYLSFFFLSFFFFFLLVSPFPPSYFSCFAAERIGRDPIPLWHSLFQRSYSVILPCARRAIYPCKGSNGWEKCIKLTREIYLFVACAHEYLFSFSTLSFPTMHLSHLSHSPPLSLQLAQELQGGRFDYADRMFHNTETLWELTSSTSTSDVKVRRGLEVGEEGEGERSRLLFLLLFSQIYSFPSCF